MKTFLTIILIVACGTFFMSWNISYAEISIISSPQIEPDELYITSTTDFAHSTEYQFCIKKDKANHLPKWSPIEELPLATHEAARVATTWYRAKYPEAKTAQIQSVSIQSLQETDKSHWYFSFFISTTDEAELKALGYAIPIAIVLFDGTVVDPKAIGACKSFMPIPRSNTVKPFTSESP